ncbi:MAG: MFS transporter [Acidimicrobiia bacterium]
MARRFFVDITPLRSSRQYRLLFSGQIVSLIGRQLTVVAAPIQVFQLTGSTLAVGLLGLAQFPALLLGSILGGTLSDAMDRRRLLVVTQVLLGATTVGLALNASLSAPSTTAVYALTAANALLSGIDAPARTASVPRLVPTSLLPAAYALQVLMFQSATAVGPAIAGVVIAQVSIAAAFWVDTATFAVALLTLLLMKPLAAPEDGARPGFRSIVEGIRFLRTKQELKGVFVIDINAMVFGMPRALFPEIGIEVLGGGAATVGLLFAAPGIGATVAALTSGWVARIRRAGIATTVAVVVWGLGVAAFGVTSSVALAVVFLALAGAGDAVSAVFRQTILQVTTPDRLRGRLSAVQIAVVAGGPRIGDAEAGVVAAGFGPRIAAWSGGLASALGAIVVARVLPRFRTWTVPNTETSSELDVRE